MRRSTTGGKKITLKNATKAVLICVGLSLFWTIMSVVLPAAALSRVYQTKLPSLIFIVRDVALLLFFATFFVNQK